LIDKILSGELTFKLYNFEQRGEAPTELFSSLYYNVAFF